MAEESYTSDERKQQIERQNKLFKQTTMSLGIAGFDHSAILEPQSNVATFLVKTPRGRKKVFSADFPKGKLTIMPLARMIFRQATIEQIVSLYSHMGFAIQ